MAKLEQLNEGESTLYKDGFFSGDFNQDLYLKKSKMDVSNRPKYVLRVYSKINGELVLQGYLYFFLDYKTKASYFIGLKVMEEFRNLNIGSFLVASWIDLCINNGYNFLGVNEKQRKPFLLYLLKTYGFEIFDKSLYQTRPDVISICRNIDFIDKSKMLLFKNEKHEKVFMGTNIYKSDNYKIIHDTKGVIILDNVILPLQSRKKVQVDYTLIDEALAKTKTESVISNHKR